MNRRTRSRLLSTLISCAALVAVVGVESETQASGGSFQRISGEGSSWSANAIDAMRVNVRQFGITVDYNPSGSTAGRKNFLNGTVDFAASDIPFQFEPEDGSAPENPAPGSYAYMPITAGGTAFMYNLVINGKRVTNLRLSGENVAKLFTGQIKTWNDPALQADNPGLVLPARAVVPVVRSDGSGSTAQLTAWMIDRHPAIWNDYCARSGRAPKCGFTSFYPTITGMIAQAGDIGVAGYVSQGFAEGAIGYVNYSYALGAQFPVAKVLNAAGYYTEPTPQNVAVALLKAQINTDESNPATYLTQKLEGVYTDTDPRSYQLSSYSYLILPTKVGGQFNEDKGRTLGAFAYYALCQAQQQSASLGYSPMPINLVQAGFEQIAKIPGVDVQSINVKDCKNPTFSENGTNVLAQNAPQPLPCDKQGPSQCPNGTGGLANVPTAVTNPTPTPATTVPGAPATTVPGTGGGSTGGGSTGGGSTGGGSTGGGSTGGGSTGGGSTGGGSTGGGSTGGGSVTTLPGTVGGEVPDGSGGEVIDPGTGLVDPGQSGCDPETGICGGDTSGNGQVAVGGGGGGLPQGAQVATVVAKSAGSGPSLALVVLVVLMLLAVVLVPALAWRQLSRGGAA
jgi:phosphate transport system substrate-binding protein